MTEQIGTHADDARFASQLNDTQLAQLAQLANSLRATSGDQATDTTPDAVNILR